MAVMSAKSGVSALPSPEWWARFRWGMAEKADRISFLAFPADSGGVAEYEEGVAFAEGGEARWRKAAEGLWRLVWIDEAGGRLEHGNFVELAEAGEDTVLLWGTESRIPVRPRYPGLDGGRRVQARLRHYEFEEKAWTMGGGFEEKARTIGCGLAARQRAKRRISRLVCLEEAPE